MAVELLAGFVTSPGLNATGIADAYTFSSSPELLRFRAATSGAERVRHVCDDFAKANGADAAVPALSVYLHGARRESPDFQWHLMTSNGTSLQ